MKKFIFLFLVIFLYSCNGKQNNLSIPLFNQYVFEVRPDEKQVSLNQQVQDEYLKAIEGVDVQIPLFKGLRGQGYMILIGIPYGMKTEDLTNSKVFSPLESPLYPNSFYREGKMGDRAVMQIITQPDKNWLSVLVISQNEGSLDIDTNTLLKRIVRIEK